MLESQINKKRRTMEKDTDKSLEKTWTDQETIAFLEAYKKRRSEFLSRRQKKFAMGHVLEDLLAEGSLTEPITTEMLNLRMKYLLCEYKACQKNNRRTGDTTSRAPFEDHMRKIFGTAQENEVAYASNFLNPPLIAGMPFCADNSSSAGVNPTSSVESNSSATPFPDPSRHGC